MVHIRFFYDLIKPSQIAFYYIAIPAGMLSYVAIMSMFLPKLFSTHYLTLYSDGSIAYKPFFKTRFIKFSPDVRWEVSCRSVKFHDVDGSSRDFDLPKTIAPTNMNMNI